MNDNVEQEWQDAAEMLEQSQSEQSDEQQDTEIVEENEIKTVAEPAMSTENLVDVADETIAVEDVTVEPVVATEQAVEPAEQASVATDEVADAFAKIYGETLKKLPEDLYIPPDALEVFLDTFEGPLDLLLYLIRRQNLDILDIPITKITLQYMEYIDLMQDMRLELAAEYLVMAAMLAEIKSRMLLPRHTEDDDEEVDDPRAELIRRLQEYEQFKKAAEDLDQLPRVDRDIFIADAQAPEWNEERPRPTVDFKELIMAFKEVMARAKFEAHHHIQREPLSIRERMTGILDRLQQKEFMRFTDCFAVKEGKLGVVVSFIAILELLKQSMVELVQSEPFAPIHLKMVANAETEELAPPDEEYEQVGM